MPGFREVDFLNHGRQCGRLPTARRSADQDETIGMSNQAFEVRMEIEFVDGGLKRGKQADRQSDAARRLQNINATAHAVNGPGKIKGATFQEAWPLLCPDQRSGRVDKSPGGQ